jgi:hypothetical protein
MIVLIVKDSATQVPREVKDLAEAQSFADQGHHVLVQNDDGTKVPLAEALAAAAPAVETKAYPDGTTATGPAPLPDASPAPAPKKPKGIVAKVKAAVTRKKK